MFGRNPVGAASVILATVLAVGATSVVPGDSKAFTSITAKSWEPTNDKATQLLRDVEFFHATLFPDPEKQKAMAPFVAKNPELQVGVQKTKRTQKILGHLFLAMAYGGLKYCTAGDGSAGNLMDWKWPLATALGHGQRIVFELKGTEGLAFYNLLVGEVVVNKFNDPYTRTAASHGFEWKAGKLHEVKYKGLKLAYSLSDGVKGLHHGINLAFGGLFNPRLDEDLVGPLGMALHMDKAKGYVMDSKRQHGHLFLHHDTWVKDGKAVEGALMVGLEGSESGKQSMYGATHSMASALKDATKGRSVTGGQKMQKLLGAEGPAEYGGMWVQLDPAQFQALKACLVAVDNLDDSARRSLFRTLLASNAVDAKTALKAALPSLR